MKELCDALEKYLFKLRHSGMPDIDKCARYKWLLEAIVNNIEIPLEDAFEIKDIIDEHIRKLAGEVR